MGKQTKNKKYIVSNPIIKIIQYNDCFVYENIIQKLTEYINMSKAGIIDGSSIALPVWKSSNMRSPNSFNNFFLSQVLNDSTVFLFIKWPRAIYLEVVSSFMSL